jgi:hypothetical protein
VVSTQYLITSANNNHHSIFLRNPKAEVNSATSLNAISNANYFWQNRIVDVMEHGKKVRFWWMTSKRFVFACSPHISITLTVHPHLTEGDYCQPKQFSGGNGTNTKCDIFILLLKLLISR